MPNLLHSDRKQRGRLLKDRTPPHFSVLIPAGSYGASIAAMMRRHDSCLAFCKSSAFIFSSKGGN